MTSGWLAATGRRARRRIHSRGWPRLDISDEELDEASISDSLCLTTLTNSGYLPYTRNLVRSLERLDLADKLIVFCLDDESARTLASEGARVHRLPTSDTVSELQRYKQGRFRDVVRYKFTILQELLGRGFSVLFTDGDVVFLRDPVAQLVREFEGVDVLIQNDDPADSSNTLPRRINLCTGFFLVRPTRRTRRLFQPSRLTSDHVCDQRYFNSVKKQAGEIRVLDRDGFPNGSWFLHRPGEPSATSFDQANIVHFNWLGAEDKIAAMKQHSLWLADD